MGKDSKARRQNIATVAAIGGLYAAIVDTMRELEIPNATIHLFLDRVEEENSITLTGSALGLLDDMVAVIRLTVAGND